MRQRITPAVGIHHMHQATRFANQTQVSCVTRTALFKARRVDQLQIRMCDFFRLVDLRQLCDARINHFDRGGLSAMGERRISGNAPRATQRVCSCRRIDNLRCRSSWPLFLQCDWDTDAFQDVFNASRCLVARALPSAVIICTSSASVSTAGSVPPKA